LGAVVGGNHLYHATSAAGLKGILSSGSIRSATGPQAATVAQTNLPTVSVTRDWGYASGSQAQSQLGGIGRDVILVLDRNAIESNFKTLGTSQSEIVKGLSFNPYITKGGVARSQNTDQLARANAKAKMQYAAPTAKAGGEFEEAVVVPNGELPLDKTMVGFWVNPKSELMKDPAIMNDPRRLDMIRPNTFVKASDNTAPSARAPVSADQRKLNRKAGQELAKQKAIAYKQGVAEGSLMEGPELASTLKHIVDNGKYITQVYDNLKQMAKKFVDNRGDLKGFAMMAGGVGSRWYNDFYFNKLQTELYALTKQAPKYAAELHEFLKGSTEDRDRKISFTEISRSLPAILYKMGQRMGNKELSHFAASWNNRRQDYEAYLDQIEAEAGMDDDSGYYEPSVKPERDHTSGKQNAQADVLINQAIKDHIPARHQGEIRNMINKLPMNSRFAALEKAINKFKAVEEAAGVGIVTKQNTTADVGPGTLGKMLKAFKL